MINAPGNVGQQMQALLIEAEDGEGQDGHIFDLPNEIDDEQQLVEIAIALSLQEQVKLSCVFIFFLTVFFFNLNLFLKGADHQDESHDSDHGYALVGQQELLDQGHSSDTTASGGKIKAIVSLSFLQV